MENITYLYLPLADTSAESMPASTEPAVVKQQKWLSQHSQTSVKPAQTAQQQVVEPDRDRLVDTDCDSTFYSYPTMYF
jgi:hypothetical protein